MTDIKSKNITWHESNITKEDRERLHGHKPSSCGSRGCRGRSRVHPRACRGAGPLRQGLPRIVLDGDNIRHGLNKNLGFSPEDREENIRRIGEVAKLFTQAGVIALTAFISPYRADRDKARELLNDGEFVEVYLKCAVDVCESRDVKGLYKKARAGEIKEFTGISAPYEEPLNPELVIDTAAETLEESTRKVLAYLQSREIIG